VALEPRPTARTTGPTRTRRPRPTDPTGTHRIRTCGPALRPDREPRTCCAGPRGRTPDPLLCKRIRGSAACACDRLPEGRRRDEPLCSPRASVPAKESHRLGLGRPAHVVGDHHAVSNPLHGCRSWVTPLRSIPAPPWPVRSTRCSRRCQN